MRRCTKLFENYYKIIYIQEFVVDAGIATDDELLDIEDDGIAGILEVVAMMDKDLIKSLIPD